MLSTVWIGALAGVFIGCTVNTLLLEVLVREAPGCSNLVTFAQFAFIAAVGLVRRVERWQWPLRLRPTSAPFTAWAGVVALFYAASVSNNLSLSYSVSVPAQIVFRSAILPINMVLGRFVLDKRYRWTHIVSVLVVASGVALFGLASIPASQSARADQTTPDAGPFAWGMALQLVSLVLSGVIGLLQETLSKRYEVTPDESMFCIHALSLPLFLLQREDIVRRAIAFSASAPMNELVPVPRLWFVLLLNVATQYVCARGVYTLTTITTSLTVQVILATRKTVSLVLSIFYFDNPFSMQQGLLAATVFGGTLMYTQAELASRTQAKPAAKPQTEPAPTASKPTPKAQPKAAPKAQTKTSGKAGEADAAAS